MQRVIKILMGRDKIRFDEAKELVEDCREAILDAIEAGDFDGPYEIIQSDLGLEPDYLDELIF